MIFPSMRLSLCSYSQTWILVFFTISGRFLDNLPLLTFWRNRKIKLIGWVIAFCTLVAMSVSFVGRWWNDDLFVGRIFREVDARRSFVWSSDHSSPSYTLGIAMSERRSNILFEDIFDIKDMDKGGKRFDRGDEELIWSNHDTWIVSRLTGTSENYEMELILDFNNEIYPLEVSTKFTLVLADNLSLDGQPGPEEGVYDNSGKKTLADKYEYVMYGKVFKFAEEKNPSPKLWVWCHGGWSILIWYHRSIFVSYGGLLMMLKGDPRNLPGITLDSRIYLLMKKVS